MDDLTKCLCDLIDKADYAYYIKGTTNVEDALYDQWKVRLAQLDPTNPRLASVGAKVSETHLQKRAHSIPMGSQTKALNKQEFDQWYHSLKLSGSNDLFHASYKMDGGSFSFEYKAGRLVAAISRGDGLTGEDITINALKFQGLPTNCKLDGIPFTGFVRGEVVLQLEDWVQVDPEKLSNPRNCAVGIARRKNGEQSEMLTVYAFGIYNESGKHLSKSETLQIAKLQALGFNTVPTFTGDIAQVWAFFQETGKKRSTLSYWIDGVVIKLDDITQQIQQGQTDNRPKGQTAIKFEAEGAVTTLRMIEVSVGSTGSIVPVGYFDPVQIGGTTISCATLCNWDNIKELNLGLNDEIYVIKAGDIIPRIMEVRKKAVPSVPIAVPSFCPMCMQRTGKKANVSGEESTTLYCLNPNCKSKVTGYIERYLSSLNILGIGEALINSLVKDLGVKDIADLYTLHLQPEALANLTLGDKVRFGEKRADKVLAAIDATRQLTLSQFLGSLGIFGLGKRRVTLIQDAVPGELDTIEDWLSGKLVQLATQASIPNIAQRIHNELQQNEQLIIKILANGVTIIKTDKPSKTQANPNAYTICITGSLSKPKSYYWDAISKAGHISTDDFNKNVTHLVAADPNGTSSKLKKARTMNIPILSELELNQLLNQN